MSSINVRIAGANGDGVESSGTLLLKVAANDGLQVFGYRGYQSIIRGGHVWFQVRVGDGAERLLSHGEGIDVLVALNQDAIKNQRSHLNAGASIIYDPTKINVQEIDPATYKLLPIPLLDIAVKESGDPIMRNTVAIGAVIKLIGINMSVFEDVIKRMFGRKGDAVVKSNVSVASKGYSHEGISTVYSLKSDGKARYTMDGNTALAIGAYASDCKFYSAYPMTPASGILHWFAAHDNKGVLFKQTEDEIAAINMAIGASFSGVRAMTGSSGGGFSLMVEALGFAGMIETPLVVVEVQRTGPSTGLPTKTEQADLLFVMHASQGEYPRIVVAPRDIDECFTVAVQAFNLADKYQCPVIIISDLFLAEHFESVDGFDIDSVRIDRGKMVMSVPEGTRFKRYEYSDDGVSPRAIPGTKGTEFIAGSDEHDEYGDLVSDAFSGIDEYVDIRVKMHDKRMRKMDVMLKNENLFVPSIENPNAKQFLVTWGSTTMTAREAVKILNSKGLDFGVISFSYLFPLDKQKTSELLKGKKLIDVECNYTAQLAQVIMMNTGIDIKDRILKYDGEAITGHEIAAKAEQLLKR
ncbi:MAG: 2-oxoacid:acceptor oxidoreductase subunit alpha [Candidatus Marsarchaeota archaeon]|jgi:2-oxoglutarate ferredoxin oxidoreductase subunit alpha|nr:2-oxoacid:acceptor oxidoreductase subunit alpha [Candidatus Marsarchaeota archaeon]